MKNYLIKLSLFILLGLSSIVVPQKKEKLNNLISTFSIVAADPETGEVGVAVASRFFAVGVVVPWAKAEIGAVATQSFANTSFGWKGLELLKEGKTPEEVAKILLANDDNPTQRQFGIVSKNGVSTTYTGDNCLPWAGGRSGKNYAVQGNILTGEDVVIAMEEKFKSTQGTLADKMYAALLAGNEKGGDSRGKQSAALIVNKSNAGYGGYDDQAINIRVDDSKEPFKQLGRLLDIAQMNYAWNEAWTAFMNKNYSKALPKINHAVKLSPNYPELLYDAAIIELANGKTVKSLQSLKKSVELNAKLKVSAKKDKDFEKLWSNKMFIEITK